MSIPIQELTQVCNMLFEYLKSLDVDSVDLVADYYWDIPQTQRYDVYTEPSSFTIGQLQSDWQELEKILSGRREPISYHFVWLGAILRAIGEKGEAELLKQAFDK
ncbi:MAG: hypothetical protein NT075_28265 [Chloroflexi bacterium]|nr:hypothetical protein [Chloroflexota bacterium]